MYTNIKTAVIFVQELKKALADGRISIGEGIGLLPETIAFFSMFKDLEAIKAEVAKFQDAYNNCSSHEETNGLLSEVGLSVEGQEAWAISEAVFWLTHILIKK